MSLLFELFPIELLERILYFTDLDTLIKIENVNALFKQLILDQYRRYYYYNQKYNLCNMPILNVFVNNNTELNHVINSKNSNDDNYKFIKNVICRCFWNPNNIIVTKFKSITYLESNINHIIHRVPGIDKAYKNVNFIKITQKYNLKTNYCVISEIKIICENEEKDPGKLFLELNGASFSKLNIIGTKKDIMIYERESPFYQHEGFFHNTDYFKKKLHPEKNGFTYIFKQNVNVYRTTRYQLNIKKKSDDKLLKLSNNKFMIKNLYQI